MNILLTGSIAYDYIMKFPGYFRDHILPDRLESISLSFLVESMVRRRGGVAPNIAYTMALLGERSRLMATVGEDFEDYRCWLEARGIDTSNVRVIPGEYTASFFANTDRSNAQIASFYPGAMSQAGKLSLHAIDGPRPDFVMISPNDPSAMTRAVHECQEMGIPYLYDPSQQIPRLGADELHSGVEGALALFVNDYELGMIDKQTGLDVAGILERAKFLVVTRGEQGATIYTRSGQVPIAVVKPERIVDPTGVGDAFRGGLLAGFCRGWDWETCGRMGALAATYCLEQEGPQGQVYTCAEFVDRYARIFGSAGQLEALLEKPGTA